LADDLASQLTETQKYKVEKELMEASSEEQNSSRVTGECSMKAYSA